MYIGKNMKSNLFFYKKRKSLKNLSLNWYTLKQLILSIRSFAHQTLP